MLRSDMFLGRLLLKFSMASFVVVSFSESASSSMISYLTGAEVDIGFLVSDRYSIEDNRFESVVLPRLVFMRFWVSARPGVVGSSRSKGLGPAISASTSKWPSMLALLLLDMALPLRCDLALKDLIAFEILFPCKGL